MHEFEVPWSGIPTFDHFPSNFSLDIRLKKPMFFSALLINAPLQVHGLARPHDLNSLLLLPLVTSWE